MSDLTPAMQQYLKIKEENPDCLVLFRMGDFYETFYEDAKAAARALGITLTARGKGVKKAPLAGIPYHAIDSYLKKLVKQGYKVAIVEQLEDPKKAKGIVKRGLVRIVTPGTVIEDSILSENSNNYLTCIWPDKDRFGIASCDISTGEIMASELDSTQKLFTEIERFSPSEIIIPLSAGESSIADEIKKRGFIYNTLDDRFFWKEKAVSTIKEQFGVETLEGFGLGGKDHAAQSTGAILAYIQETQKRSASHLRSIRSYTLEDYMIIDPATLKNLELLKNIRDNTQRGTLFEVINRTCTSMGARELKKWLLRPLLDKGEIEKRHDSVEELIDDALKREELREILTKISDIERIITRVNYGTANARDLVSLREALSMLPGLKDQLKGAHSTMLMDIEKMEELSEIKALISEAITDEPPVTVREGNLIKKGYSPELDELRTLSTDTKSWISEFEDKERERTGIKSLRVRFNKVFGYFIEVTKANLSLVPDDYIRKQTQVNSERFITEELKEKESVVLGAHDKICALEYDLFVEVIGRVITKNKEIQDISSRLSDLDCLLSLAQVASENRYSRPAMDTGPDITIKGGRHPVVERIEAGRFVDNDTELSEQSLIHIITGPNMAGKSTYLRQVALITLLAQIGSFVPAEKAQIGIVDRIFTRVGAVDDLSMGQSTFMVEMTEVANIVNNATGKSLIIMDEVGRGTSTYDGLSLAWAITEHIEKEIGAKTLFATHYHQLNRLSASKPRIRNFNIHVKEEGKEIIFMRKIVPGGTDKSYGIHVARLAGLPRKVIERARVIQGGLEDQESLARSVAIQEPVEEVTEEAKPKKEQLSLFESI